MSHQTGATTARERSSSPISMRASDEYAVSLHASRAGQSVPICWKTGNVPIYFVRRACASRYFALVFATISGGNFGAGAFLFQSSVSR